MVSEQIKNQSLFRLSLFVWVIATLLRFWNVQAYAGLGFDDVAYATSGRDMLLEGRGYWADALRPLAAWFVAIFHKINGISVVNVGIAFATLRSLGELFLILAARRFFPVMPWAPLWSAGLSCASFLGASYGKQHVASLLCTVPLSLWLYARYLDTGRMRDWIVCAVASGLVFLSHYNTIAVLVFMLGLEMVRLLLARNPFKHIAVIGLSGCLTSFVAVMILGKISYGYTSWGSYLVKVWHQIAFNQTRQDPHLSDGFLSALISWEGAAFGLYFIALVWWLRRMWNAPVERKYLALVLVPILGGAMIVVRMNTGFLGFPRLYVFALPFVWILGAAFLSRVTALLLDGKSLCLARGMAVFVVVLTLFVGASHQAMARRAECPNAALEAYFRSHRTERIVAWAGNPHLATFWFNEMWRPVLFTREEGEEEWKRFAANRISKRVPPELLQPDHAVYLQRRDLAKVCDLVVLQNCNLALLRQCDASIRQNAPRARVVDFFNGAALSLPLMSEDGALDVAADFNENSTLPIVRVYDLRGGQ